MKDWLEVIQAIFDLFRILFYDSQWEIRSQGY